MSRAIFDAPTIVPAASLIGDTLMDTSMGVPSLRTRTVSKCSTDFPDRMRAMTTCSSLRRSGGMMIVTGRPIASPAM